MEHKPLTHQLTTYNWGGGLGAMGWLGGDQGQLSPPVSLGINGGNEPRSPRSGHFGCI